MANSPTTSLTISFTTEVLGGDSKTSLQAAVESEDNAGKTSFIFGDTVKYRLYKSPDITSISVFTSDGAEALDQSGLVQEMEETILFDKSPTSNIKFGLESSFAYKALGNSNLGVLTCPVGSNVVTCSKPSTNPLIPTIGVYNVTYKTKYDRRKLSSVAEPAGFGVGEFKSYPVIVFILGVVG